MLLGAYVGLDELLGLRASVTRGTRSRRATVQHGEKTSKARGRGMDFAEVRAYQPGDDVRSIDWRVTARRNKPHTKVFQEEKERPTLIMVDQTRPMFFGSKARLKSVAAAEIAARLAWQSLANNDRVGGIVAADTGLAVHRPLRNARAVARLLHDLAKRNAALNAQTLPDKPFKDALTRLAHIARSGHRIHIVTDCHALEQEDREKLLHLSRHNEVHAIFVYDVLETHLPPANRYRVTDRASTLAFHSGNTKLRQEYKERFQHRKNALESLCRDVRIRCQFVTTTTPLERVLGGA